MENAGKEELNTENGRISKKEECHGNETSEEYATDKKEHARNW
jgi:hypothetical protein